MVLLMIFVVVTTCEENAMFVRPMSNGLAECKMTWQLADTGVERTIPRLVHTLEFWRAHHTGFELVNARFLSSLLVGR